jgi:hypothetical protein
MQRYPAEPGQANSSRRARRADLQSPAVRGAAGGLGHGRQDSLKEVAGRQVPVIRGMASRVLSLSTADCLEMLTRIDADESPPQHHSTSGFAGQPSAGLKSFSSGKNQSERKNHTRDSDHVRRESLRPCHVTSSCHDARRRSRAVSESQSDPAWRTMEVLARCPKDVEIIAPLRNRI